MAKTCTELVLDKLKGRLDITDEQASILAARIVAEMEAVRDGAKVQTNDVAAAMKERIARNRIKVEQKLAESMDNKRKLEGFWARIQAQDESVAGDVVLGIVGGSRYSDFSGRVYSETIRERILEKMRSILRKMPNQLRKDLADEKNVKLIRDTFNELYNRKTNPGLTKNPDAKLASELIGKVHDQYLVEMRQAGVEVEELVGYIMRQTHDSAKVSEAGFDNWFKFMWNRLDLERVKQAVRKNKLDHAERGWKKLPREKRKIGDLEAKMKKASEVSSEDIKDYLKAAYQDIIGDNHRLIDEDLISDDAVIRPNKFTQNIAKQAQEARKLHFKSGEAAYEYNKNFGRGDLMSAVHNEIEHSSRGIANIRHLGTNPRAQLQRLAERVKKQKITNPKAAEKFDKVMGKADQIMDVLEGRDLTPARGKLAKGLAMTQQGIAMSHLGNATLRSITDIANFASELTDLNGKNYFQNLAEVTNELTAHLMDMDDFRGLSTAEKNKLREQLGVAFQEMGGHFHLRFHVDNPLGGGFYKAQQLFYRVNGLEWWTQSIKEAASTLAAKRMGGLLDKTEWGELTKRQQAKFKQYGIDEAAWGKLKGAVDDYDFKGVKDRILTPEGVRKLGLSRVEAESLENGVAAYLTDFANTSSPTPDIRTRALVTGGKSADDPDRMIRSSFLQFMSFPIQMTANMKRRITFNTEGKIPTSYKDYLNSPDLKSNLAVYASMMVTMTALAYVGDTLIEASRGRTPKDATDPKVLVDMFLKGGGGAMYADFLIGDYRTRSGEAFFPGAFGPIPGKINDVASMYSGLLRGDADAGRVFKFMTDFLPGRNLFYTRMALDNLIMLDLQERLNPGAVGRMKGWARKNGQEYFIEPQAEGLPTALGF